MNIYQSKIWLSDLDEVIEKLPQLNELEGKTVMITGCTGLICSTIVDVLARWNNQHNNKISILAAGRNKEKVAKRFASYIDEEWFTYVFYDAIFSDNVFPNNCDYIVCGASNASPNKIIEEPVETMLGNILGIKYLLDYALRIGAERVIYISTSEVYGKREHNAPSKLDEYGGIDILNPRSSYSIGKCAAETMCISYADEYGVETVIVRPGHIYGPTADKEDNRVSSAWAYKVAAGKDIVMKSDGAQIRSYCYCADCASAILKVMLQGQSSCAYNISNPTSVISIKELASILSSVGGVSLKLELPSKDEKRGFNPMNNSSLDSTELLNLGWNGLFDAERGLSHTVNIIRELSKA